MYTISTKRHTLRPISENDFDFIYTLFTHPKVSASYSEPPLMFKQDLPNFLKKLCSHDNMVWVIYTNETPINRIGICALHHWNKNQKTIEIGGTLLPAYWGDEIMKECFQEIIQLAYDELQIENIIGKTSSKNSRAINLVNKLGFELHSSTENELLLIKSKRLLPVN